MNRKLLSQTKEIIEEIPEDKLRVVYAFARWIAEEELTKAELDSIVKGEKEINKGLSAPWRSVARTI